MSKFAGHEIEIIRDFIRNYLAHGYTLGVREELFQILTSVWMFERYKSSKAAPDIYIISPINEDKRRILDELNLDVENFKLWQFRTWTYVVGNTDEDINFAKLMLNESSPSKGLIPINFYNPNSFSSMTMAGSNLNSLYEILDRHNGIMTLIKNRSIGINSVS